MMSFHCFFSFYTMHHLCEQEDVWGYDGNSIWAFLIVFCHYCACSQYHESCFFVFHWNTWYVFSACNHLSSHQVPLYSCKLLLSLTTLSLTTLLSVKHFLMQTKLTSESEITLKRSLIIFILVSSNASRLNWKESQSIFSVSNMELYPLQNFYQWVLITKDMTRKKWKWKM